MLGVGGVGRYSAAGDTRPLRSSDRAESAGLQEEKEEKVKKKKKKKTNTSNLSFGDDVEEMVPEELEAKNEELWVIRFSNQLSGNKLASALNLLNSHDILEGALKGATLREDYAPKGAMQKQLEGLLAVENPRNKNAKKK